MKNKEEKLTEVIERKDEEIKRHVFEKGDIEKSILLYFILFLSPNFNVFRGINYGKI